MTPENKTPEQAQVLLEIREKITQGRTSHIVDAELEFLLSCIDHYQQSTAQQALEIERLKKIGCSVCKGEIQEDGGIWHEEDCRYIGALREVGKLQTRLAALQKVIHKILANIEADAMACERDAENHKAQKDELNSYLMGTQAMAHRLDIQRMRRAISATSSVAEQEKGGE